MNVLNTQNMLIKCILKRKLVTKFTKNKFKRKTISGLKETPLNPNKGKESRPLAEFKLAWWYCSFFHWRHTMRYHYVLWVQNITCRGNKITCALCKEKLRFKSYFIRICVSSEQILVQVSRNCYVCWNKSFKIFCCDHF